MRDALSLRARDAEHAAWQSLDPSNVHVAPDAYGVVEIANSRKARILVVHGVLREELQRILVDPQSKVHDARFFRCHVTLTIDQAARLQEDLLRAYDQLGLPPPLVGDFSRNLPAENRGRKGEGRQDDAD